MGLILSKLFKKQPKANEEKRQGGRIPPPKDIKNPPSAQKAKKDPANGRMKSLCKPASPSRPPMAEITDEIRSACAAAVLEVFPDICPDFLDKTAADCNYNHGQVIQEICDRNDANKPYPTKPRVSSSLKRKRRGSDSMDQASKARCTYGYANRPKETASVYVQESKKALAQDFPRAALKSIAKLLEENDNHLLSTYLALDEINRKFKAGTPSLDFVMKKTRTTTMPEYKPAQLDETIRRSAHGDQIRALEELRAARLVCEIEANKRRIAEIKERQEQENLERAQADGTAADCRCCYGEFAKNRMVRCADPSKEHLFCVDCARLNAENVIGQNKFELTCMSTDGCSAGFSVNQRSLFLDDNLVSALDRIEYAAVLDMAGIKNLAQCPFCPYAEEYPPVEVNKEFRCANEDCMAVTCRLCNQETHIPKTCEEAARENGTSARREIEEAMSAALIRKCNKCGTPFIKEAGCNKMTCSRSGCRNVQCYVCSKSCDYSHFNDPSRGGKKGNCALFDESIEARHEREVQEAEEKARQKVIENNPKVEQELLKFAMPGNVQKNKENNTQQLERNAQQVQHLNQPFGYQDLLGFPPAFPPAPIHQQPNYVAPAPPQPPPPPPLPSNLREVVAPVQPQPGAALINVQPEQRLRRPAGPPLHDQNNPPMPIAPLPLVPPYVRGKAEGKLPEAPWRPQLWQIDNAPVAIGQSNRQPLNLNAVQPRPARSYDAYAPVAHAPAHPEWNLDRGIQAGAAAAENNLFAAQLPIPEPGHGAPLARSPSQSGYDPGFQLGAYASLARPQLLGLQYGQFGYALPEPYGNPAVQPGRVASNHGRTVEDPLEVD